MINILLHDMKHGCLEQWKKYMVIVVITVFSCITFSVQYTRSIQISKFSSGDYLFWNFRGMNYIVAMKFVIPSGFWLALNLFLAIIIGSYPVTDLHGLGQQKLMRLKRKNRWWLGKCLWCILSVILYYMILLVTIGACSMILGKGFQIDVKVLEKFIPGFAGNSNTETLLIFMGIMIMISIVVSLLQMFISVMLNVTLGYVLVAAWLVSAVYVQAGFSPGNLMMLIRMYQMKLYIPAIISVATVVAALVVFAGAIMIKRKDVCSKKII